MPKSTNDPEAERAVQALKAAGKNGVKDVFLVGFNGDPPALELIKNDEMAATIRQDPYGQAQRCVEIATKLMNNETVEYSDPATKSILFPVEVIDKENVDQFSKSRRLRFVREDRPVLVASGRPPYPARLFKNYWWYADAFGKGS